MSTGTSETTPNRKPYSLTNPMVVNGAFYIPSDALLPGIDKIALKDNDLFVILDSTGQSPRIYDQELGFFYKDTRYVDTWELNINGEAATSLTKEAMVNARSVVFQMTNRDIVSLDYGGRIPRDRLHVERIITLDKDQVLEHVEIVNFDGRPHTIELERRAASRFNDIFEVRGMQRPERGHLQKPHLSDDRRAVILSYTGLDQHQYKTRIWSPQPVDLVTCEDRGVVITHRVSLPPKATCSLKYVVAFDREPVPTLAGRDFADMTMTEHVEAITKLDERPQLPLPEIEADSPLLSRALSNAAVDIAALLTRRGEDLLYPDAGIPWFCAPFGRDGLITAYQMLPWCPQIACGVLRYAFERLGTKDDPFTDEEPGKVFHEMRYGEMAALKEVPFIPYYGSVDSTPLALILLGEYAAWTNDGALVRRYWEQARQALEWVRSAMATGIHGFLSYKARRASGLRNQGWKDSHDSVMHADGRLAEPPIALCEVQGYAYRALLTMARLARGFGFDQDQAEVWEREAEQLRERFNKHFWDEDRGLIVLALDGEGQPCRVLASNQGHCLWTWLPDQGQAQRIAKSLLSDAMFSGYGIRTLATSETAYNPLSYHNGSVWPHDNSLIAEGLRYFDCNAELSTLAGGILGVVAVMGDSRLPELFCGFPKYANSAPVPYDVACKPQAWAAGTLFLMIKAMLGLGMSIGDSPLVFRSPLLPPSMKRLEIRKLPIRDYELDFIVRRGAITCTVEILRKTGGTGQVIVMK